MQTLKLSGNNRLDRRLEKAFSMSFDTAANRYSELTERERQVANAIANGTRSKKIAEVLGISPKTLDIHRTNVLRKLETKSVVVVGRIVYMVRIAGLGETWQHEGVI